MTTVMWVSMSVHVGAFLFWMIMTAVTQWAMNKKQKELERIYDDAREELAVNLENVKKMAHAANQEYVKNLFKGGGDGLYTGS